MFRLNAEHIYVFSFYSLPSSCILSGGGYLYVKKRPGYLPYAEDMKVRLSVVILDIIVIICSCYYIFFYLGISKIIHQIN